MSARLLAIVGLSAFVASAPQAPAVTGTGLILGQVIDGGSGKPVAGVTVALNGTLTPPPETTANGRPPVAPAFPSRSVLTDADGYFVFAAVPAGRFGLNATKPGYLNGSLGQTAPAAPGFGGMGASRFDLADNERRRDIRISIWKPASISGTVVDEAGEPVVGIDVKSVRRGPGANSVAPGLAQNTGTTDDRGMYRISGLGPGSYILMITSTRSTTPVSVQDAYNRARQDGSLTEFSRQLDANGADYRTSGVPVGSLLMSSGSDSVLGSGRAATGPMITDERRLTVYETAYYAAASSVSRATVLTLRSGDDRTGVDFQLRPVPAVRVSGTVVGPEGPASMIGLRLARTDVEDQLASLAFDSAGTTSDATGAFTFLGVTPGQYVLRVLKTPPRPVTPSSMTSVIQMGDTRISSGGGPTIPPPIPNEPTLSATQSVAVGDQDVTGLTVSLAAGARISGRIQFEGAAAPPPADRVQQLSVSIDPVDARIRNVGNGFMIFRGQFDAGGRFSTYQLPNGAYVLRPGPLTNWTLKAVTLKGQDVMDAPIELTGSDVADVVFVYTDASAQLSGTVRGDAGQPEPSAVVLLFPTDPIKWKSYSFSSRRLRGVRVSRIGGFTFPDTPPGDYFVVAVRDDQATDWPDAAFLQTLSTRATRVTIADGDKKTQDLRIVVLR